MRREHLLARLLRALSGKSQEKMGEEIGLHTSHVAQFELGKVLPSPEHLERLAAGAGITLREAREILSLYEAFRQSHRRRARGAGELLDRLAEGVRAHTEAAYRRVLNLPLPGILPKPEDRRRANELWLRLKELSQEESLAVVRVAEEFRSWALCEKVCAESVMEASRDLERAAGLAQLAREIAGRAVGPEGWRVRLRGYAAAHAANILRVSGQLKAADAEFEAAKRLWSSGSDPANLLDPGRLLDLEASLRRGQRRLGEALALLEEAISVGHAPARALIKKGFTLEVMGESKLAIEALLQAEALLEHSGDQRLMNILRCNLGFSLCQVGRFAEAANVARRVGEIAVAMGDEILALRVTWLEGRIAAGTGRFEEAHRLLGQARREFAARSMWYDVALALLEEAVLLLDEGRTAEVKELARGLAEVFESKKVHREALAALRLFQEAAEREVITAELARRVLGDVLRAR